ncbi:hypothetical protein K450DRAFT_232864 [Umbelopsis ramanniana AG]|uniref:Uncharacterized protein n=1 Tax=Umbelopsis ramanniana AG TaxID=1314678 RepID=A0AAD5EDN6_UMBRA|nr:uncharacterized protein K450DRAFT_232864 [Umbelopsis ramanniana AG]KAI8581397.1 hypothetical protein K450DRAFT_232864 [Umbelopsis ramanniana AG]
MIRLHFVSYYYYYYFFWAVYLTKVPLFYCVLPQKIPLQSRPPSACFFFTITPLPLLGSVVVER